MPVTVFSLAAPERLLKMLDQIRKTEIPGGFSRLGRVDMVNRGAQSEHNISGRLRSSPGIIALMSVPFTKMHGCQNDYIYVEDLESQIADLREVNLSKLAIKISDRKMGLGSDGLIILQKSLKPEAQAFMRMYNSDGSEGRMCGNGIRCVTKLLYEKLGPREVYLIDTLSGVKSCYVVQAQDPKRFMVRVNMGRPSFLPASIPVDFDDVMVMGEEFEVDDRTFKISCVSMGNPHCVIEVQDLEAFDVKRYGSQIEKHPAFAEGVNVEFVEYRDGKIFQRTWERGSGETLACGTGACAVGVVSIMGGRTRSPVMIHLRGGDLQIDWDGLREVWMTGEAVTVEKGEFEVRQFL